MRAPHEDAALTQAASEPDEELEPARHWDRLAHYFRTAGSDLARWLLLRRMKILWEQLHPETKWGAACQRKDPKMGSLVPAFVDQAAIDTGIARSTISRWAKHAEDLVALLGEPELERLATCGYRLANNPKGILVKLAKLRMPEQAADVVCIYTEGAGEKKAAEALATYLAIQEDREPEPSAEEPEEPAELETVCLLVIGSEEQEEITLGHHKLFATVPKVEGGVVTLRLTMPAPRR